MIQKQIGSFTYNIYLEGKNCTLQDNILDYTTGLKYQLKQANSSILSNDYDILVEKFNEIEKDLVV